jgi:hypothetical protein
MGPFLMKLRFGRSSHDAYTSIGGFLRLLPDIDFLERPKGSQLREADQSAPIEIVANRCNCKERALLLLNDAYTPLRELHTIASVPLTARILKLQMTLD